MPAATCKDAGADIAEGSQFAHVILELMQRTYSERVVPNPDGSGALFSLDYDKRLFRLNYVHPLLVSSTDGVGAKAKVASMTGRHDAVGVDLVAKCVNDILTVGAEPLFFLDYLATGNLEPDVLRQVVAGIAAGCREAGCALLDGKTAEMPGFCKRGEYDVAGFVVGVVEQHRVLNGAGTERGDVVIGLASSGLHSSGHSPARQIVLEDGGLKVDDSLARFGIERSVGDELLEPTRIYVRAVRTVLRHYRVKRVVRGIAHVTDGGLLASVPRVLPEGYAVELDPSTWRRPPIFDVLQALGHVPPEEMYHTFNMGIGMVLIVADYYAASVVEQLERSGEHAAVIGRVVKGDRTAHIL